MLKNKFLLLGIILISGCYSTKYSNRYMDKLQQKNPNVFNNKMTEYHKCNWLILEMTPEDKIKSDSLFSLSK